MARRRRWACFKKADVEPIDDYRECGRNDPRTTDEFLEEALAAFRYRDSEDFMLSDAYWKPVRIFHCRADNPVMATANRLLSSEASANRVLAADILSQVAFGNEARRTEAADLLLPVFERETACEVLRAIASAFGHIKDERSVSRLVELCSHPDESLRYEVVFGLSGQDDKRAIESLIVLSSDPDDDVRNWATFGLGTQTEVDTPDLRNALIARLSDLDDETRDEALVGLARRGDTRTGPALLKEFESSSPELLEDRYLITDAANAAIEAAKKHPDKKWCLLLEKLQEVEIGDPAEIQAAIKACEGARL